jgi:hypothetical protein
MGPIIESVANILSDISTRKNGKIVIKHGIFAQVNEMIA